MEEGGCISCGDILGSGWTIRNEADPQRESWILIQEEGTANNVQGRGNKRSGLVVLQKKGILSPFCLFFCVLQRMRTEEMFGESAVVMSWMGILPSRKNSKSSTM